MALDMARLRAKLLEKENKETQSFNQNEPNAFLAHWNIPDNLPLNLRFLPDGDTNNEYFWRERDMINLTFNGIKGKDTKPTKVVVPCNEMWDGINSCPVLRVVREWYKEKDPALEQMAQRYWKKKSYILQCIIGPGSCEVKDDNPPENPIRRVILNKTLFNKVKSILMNPKVEHLPVDYVHGRDFGIIKSQNGGGFAEYDQSSWDMFERALNEHEAGAVEKFGLFDLSEFIPKKPTARELQAIEEMFEASVNGEAYDPDRWAEFYRPQGVQKPNTQTEGATSTSATQVMSQLVPPVSAPVQQPVVESVPEPTQSSAASSLAQLAAMTRTTGTASATQPTQASAPVQQAASVSHTDLLAKLAASRNK